METIAVFGTFMLGIATFLANVHQIVELWEKLRLRLGPRPVTRHDHEHDHPAAGRQSNRPGGNFVRAAPLLRGRRDFATSYPEPDRGMLPLVGTMVVSSLALILVAVATGLTGGLVGSVMLGHFDMLERLEDLGDYAWDLPWSLLAKPTRETVFAFVRYAISGVDLAANLPPSWITIMQLGSVVPSRRLLLGADQFARAFVPANIVLIRVVAWTVFLASFVARMTMGASVFAPLG